MSFFGNSSESGEKIFRGAYTYTRNKTVYCEEEFEVYKDKRTNKITFIAEQISRVSTGELLSIATVYTVNKKFIPVNVTIHRTLGTHTVIEDFEYDRLNTKINYTFDNGKEKHSELINTSPLFTIAAPAACTSMLCLKSKKFDSSSKNYYSLFTSRNLWEFKESPSTKNIIVQKLTQATENLKLGENNHQATQYRLLEDRKNGEEVSLDQLPSENEEDIKVWLSQHLTIPYLIRDEVGGTKIEIKYLNNLDRD